MFLNDQIIKLKAGNLKDGVQINLPSSKSIANRALIVNALANNKGNLNRLSEARDTRTMQKLLREDGTVWDVLDAGTTMRFLTAFAAVKGLNKTLTGTRRMKERPIGILVDALRELGAEIQYMEKPGFPPIRTGSFSGQQTGQLDVRGDISSQYISSLMMVGPLLPEGLRITLIGKIGSRPYIDMTRAVMERFGVKTKWLNDHEIQIPHQPYTGSDYTIEPDWSAASYWYSIAAISGRPIFIKDLVDDSIQGDRIMADLMIPLGIRTEFSGQGALLIPERPHSSAQVDFSNCPDLAQTVAVICAAKNINCTMFGLESLRIKETDRIAALQQELKKIGSTLHETRKNEEWVLETAKPTVNEVCFETYHDHRMAMSFAPLAWLGPIRIINPGVVSKSYPGFWDDLVSAGALISSITD